MLGGLCLAAGQLVLGMGHGWDLPRLYGLIALILYPLALIRYGWLTPTTPWRQDALITAVIALPFLTLLAATRVLPYPTGIPSARWIVLGLIALYFAVGFALKASRKQALWGDAILVLAGLLMDGAAIVAFMDSGTAQRSGLLLFPWMALWLGWQGIAMLALSRHWR